MRGCSGLPLRTPLLTYVANHEDIHEVVQYVYQNYIRDSNSGKRRQKFMAYGASLGAMMLDRYLIKYGKDVPLDGVVVYSPGWHTLEDIDYFNHNFFGIYNRGLIYPQKLLHLNTYLPQLKGLLDETTYNRMREGVQNAKYLY